jgi:hypothetical protein
MTGRDAAFYVVVGCLAALTVGCSRSSQDEIVIEVPANFSGQVHVEMGVPGAPALKQDGARYVIEIPPDGKVVTSTLITAAKPTFGNVDASRVWGYTPSISQTGDGVSVGASIEFFIGTKEQYESAEAKKKNKSQLDQVVHAENTERS